MLKFVAKEITQGAVGPVVHLWAADNLTKIELYLPKGYDVPVIGDALILVHESVVADFQDAVARVKAMDIGRTDPTDPTLNSAGAVAAGPTPAVPLVEAQPAP